MKGLSKLGLFALLSSFLWISGCGNSEFRDCKEKASALWDNSDKPSNNNAAYWQAIEKCKEKYQ